MKLKIHLIPTLVVVRINMVSVGEPLSVVKPNIIVFIADDAKEIYQEDSLKMDNPALQSYRNFIDKNTEDPFFLWIGFIDPHRPYNNEPIQKVNDPEKIYVAPYYVDNESTRRDIADYYEVPHGIARDFIYNFLESVLLF